MIEAETLRQWRGTLKQNGPIPHTTQRERELIDSHLEALQLIDELRETIREAETELGYWSNR